LIRTSRSHRKPKGHFGKQSRRLRSWLRVACAVAVLALAARPSFAAEGDLDPTFGPGGFVTFDFNGGVDYGYGLAKQSDGNLIVQARLSSGWALLRLTAGGSLDGASVPADGWKSA
jgi:hypothetical protein